jgi:hypothetical protein
MKPGEREESEYLRDAVEDATSDNERGPKFVEGAFGGSMGNDVSDGSAGGGRASLAGEALGQSAVDRGEPVTQMNPPPLVDDRGKSGMDAVGNRDPEREDVAEENETVDGPRERRA